MLRRCEVRRAKGPDEAYTRGREIGRRRRYDGGRVGLPTRRRLGAMVRGAGLAERSSLSVIVGLALAAVALLGASLACGVAPTTTTAVVPQTTASMALGRTTTSSTQSTAASVDRRDPESVLRGYFSAWQNGDWEGQESFMAEQYGNLWPEPVGSLRIIELRRVEGSSSHCLYRVVFDITVKGRVVSMTTGRYDWSYDLNWDGHRQSWIITNYGEG